jgi:putative flippase GtrA
MTRIEWRFSRFGLVGLMGAGLQLTIIFLLTTYVPLGRIVATLIAVEIAILHNFIWHEGFTWSDRGPRIPRQVTGRLWRFHAGNGVVSLVGNTLLVHYLVDRLNAPLVPTAIGAIILCSLANFVLADRWVYRSISDDTGTRLRLGISRRGSAVAKLLNGQGAASASRRG